MLVNMIDQFGLGVGRPAIRTAPGICNRFRDGLKVVVVFRRLSAPDGGGDVADGRFGYRKAVAPRDKHRADE
jgi:hypothetical protein